MEHFLSLLRLPTFMSPFISFTPFPTLMSCCFFLCNSYKISPFLIIPAAQTYCLFGIISLLDYHDFPCLVFHVISHTAADILCLSFHCLSGFSCSVLPRVRIFQRDDSDTSFSVQLPRNFCLFSIHLHNGLSTVPPLTFLVSKTNEP